MKEPIWIEINLQNISKNIETIRRLIGKDVKIALVIKSNAYGHGLVEVAKTLDKSGVDYLFVNNLEEALKLKNHKIKAPIIIAGVVEEDDLGKIISEKFRFFVSDLDMALKASQTASNLSKKAYIHLKIDTGMSRQGFAPDEIAKQIEQIASFKNLEIEGVATHFANSSDFSNDKFYQNQLKTFRMALHVILPFLKNKPIIHAANSGAVLLHPESNFDMVRPGIIVFGAFSSLKVREYFERRRVDLEPVLTLKSRIVQIKEIPAGASVSYDCTYQTKRPTRVGILPVGYYDGISRKLGNRGVVLVGERRVPIIGKICMNATMIDLNSVPKAEVGDEVVLIGRQGKDAILAEEIAEISDYNAHEVLTRLRDSLPRYFVNK